MRFSNIKIWIVTFPILFRNLGCLARMQWNICTYLPVFLWTTSSDPVVDALATNLTIFITNTIAVDDHDVFWLQLHQFLKYRIHTFTSPQHNHNNDSLRAELPRQCNLVEKLLLTVTLFQLRGCEGPGKSILLAALDRMALLGPSQPL